MSAVKLKQLREAAGLSQGDVAKILGYESAQLISNIERGISTFPFKSIKKLAALYKVTEKDLYLTIYEFKLQKLNNKFKGLL